jgi:hypothetical protein
MGKLTRTLLYGIRDERHGKTHKHTEFRTDGSNNHGTTFRYADGCFSIYEHKDGWVTGYHGDAKGNRVGEIRHREGSRGTKHPHHPEGQGSAVKQGKAIDWMGELAVAWDRALRWNGLRK